MRARKDVFFNKDDDFNDITGVFMVFRKVLFRTDAGTFSGGWKYSIEESEEPEGDDLSVPTLDTGEGIADVGLDASRVGSKIQNRPKGMQRYAYRALRK